MVGRSTINLPGVLIIQDLDNLRTRLAPTLDQLESLDEAAGGADRDLSSLQLLIRRTKDQLA